MTLTIWLLILSTFVAVVSIVVAVVLVTNTRALYTKVTNRNVSIAMMLATSLRSDSQFMHSLKKIKPDDLPDFLEDLRQRIKKAPHLKPALPSDSRSDGEFILYLTLQILTSGINREILMKDIGDLLEMGPLVRRAIEKGIQQETPSE